MRSRLAVPAGLVAGLLAAVALLGALVAFVPVPGPSVPPLPTLRLTPPSSSPAPSAAPSASVVPSASGPVAAVSPVASAGTSSVPAGGPFHVGAPAPFLVVGQLGGGTIDLAALRGRPIWLGFVTTTCPGCRDQLVAMGRFATRYAPSGLVVIAVDVREDAAAVLPFVNSLGLTIPVGLDPDGRALAAWSGSVLPAASLPVHVWVDAQGIVRDGASGELAPERMAGGLRTILPGVNVTP